LSLANTLFLELDTPSSTTVAPGDHDIMVNKTGSSAWNKKVSVSSGHVNLSAELLQNRNNLPSHVSSVKPCELLAVLANHL